MDYLTQLQNMADANTAKTFNFNANEAKKQRDWSTEMSNTAHQREVKDLQSAGLNPVLSSGGTGATVNSGASASGSADTSAVQALANITSSLLSANAQMYSANQSYLSSVYSSDMAYKQTLAKLNTPNVNKPWGFAYDLIFGDLNPSYDKLTSLSNQIMKSAGMKNNPYVFSKANYIRGANAQQLKAANLYISKEKRETADWIKTINQMSRHPYSAKAWAGSNSQYLWRSSR